MNILLLNDNGEINILATSQDTTKLKQHAEQHAKEEYPEGQFKWVDPVTYNNVALNETIINFEIHTCEVVL
jgi:hypothetical protein